MDIYILYYIYILSSAISITTVYITSLLSKYDCLLTWQRNYEVL